MAYRLLTDLTIAIHFSFLVFVVLGSLAARRARWLLLPHLLAVAWAVYVSVTPGLVCPLTPLENAFALRAGMAGYEGSFIEHYLVPIVYPEGLTPSAQWVLAGVVVGINACVYLWTHTSVRRWISSERDLGLQAGGVGASAAVEGVLEGQLEALPDEEL